MKKMMALFLALALVLSLSACGGEKHSNESGEVEVEKELFDVVITLPADLMEGTTQEELDESVAEGMYHAAALNEDGSVTIEMSKRQHRKYMQEMAADLEKSLQEMVGSEDYPSFTEVKAENDYTHFTVTTTSQELNLQESFSVLGFYIMGGMYAIFNGVSEPVITVDFVNADSGEIISSSSSADMGE